MKLKSNLHGTDMPKTLIKIVRRIKCENYRGICLTGAG
jgi:hypothetical protein